MKKQLKTDLQELCNQAISIRERKDEILEELKAMSASEHLPRWCNVDRCANQLIGTKFEAEANLLRGEFHLLCGELLMLNDLGRVLYDNDFWRTENE